MRLDAVQGNPKALGDDLGVGMLVEAAAHRVNHTGMAPEADTSSDAPKLRGRLVPHR